MGLHIVCWVASSSRIICCKPLWHFSFLTHRQSPPQPPSKNVTTPSSRHVPHKNCYPVTTNWSSCNRPADGVDCLAFGSPAKSVFTPPARHWHLTVGINCQGVFQHSYVNCRHGHKTAHPPEWDLADPVNTH